MTDRLADPDVDVAAIQQRYDAAKAFYHSMPDRHLQLYAESAADVPALLDAYREACRQRDATIEAYELMKGACAMAERQRDEAQAKVEKARDLVAALVRADNTNCGSGPGGRINGADTLPLQTLLGLALTLRAPMERTAEKAERDALLTVVQAAQEWRTGRKRDEPTSRYLAASSALAAAVDAYENRNPTGDSDE